MATGGIRNAIQLVADIERRIAAGHLAPGQRVDPVRAVANELGLAPNTVAAAYRTLGERGYLVGEGRRGTFVADRPALTMPLDEQLPEGLLDLASGNPDPELLPDLGPAIAAIDVDHVLYGGSSLHQPLIDLFRAELASDDVEVGQLVIVGGALDGIERVLMSHLRPGDKVAIEDPGYSAVAQLIAAMGFRAVPVAVDGSGPVPEAVVAALAEGAGAVIVTPRAQNPTGAAIDEERADQLRAVLVEHPDVLLVSDDHAGRVAGQPYLHPAPPGHRRWAMVRSVAKSLGPDLRVAALAGDDTTINRVSGRQAVGTGWVSHLLQRIVAELMASPEVQRQLDEARRAYAARREAVIEVLVAAGVAAEGRSGLNVWVPVDDEALVVAGMERRGFAVRSGSRYRHESRPGVRISIARAGPDVLTAAAGAFLEVVGARPATRAV